MTHDAKKSISARAFDTTIIATFFALLVLIAVLQTIPDIPSVENSLVTKSLTAVPPGVNLGRVDQGVAVPFSFALRNNSQEPITIAEVVRPCTCSELNLKAGIIIGPRSEIQVEGKIDTTGKRNEFVGVFPTIYKSKTINTRTSCIFTLKMSVRPAINSNVEKVVLRGEDRSIVRLSSADGRKFRVKSVEVTLPEIRWEPVHSTLDEDTDLFILGLRWVGRRKMPNATKSWVKFETTVSTEPVLQIPITDDDSAGR